MIGLTEIVPLLVFAGIVLVIWAVLSMISNRNSKAVDRLNRLGRPREKEDLVKQKSDKLKGLVDAAKAMSSPLMPQSENEQNDLAAKLSQAGFRSEAAPMVYSGLRIVCLGLSLLISMSIFVPRYGLNWSALQWIIAFTGIGFYLPNVTLWYIRSTRQLDIFLTLPDALDLLVVCVESGLGLDAGMRRVCEELGPHAKVICEEFSLANMQLQMGKQRREVLHDLGQRTGVDDVKALAAILIQADRFGSSIAHALRVQSDAMRTRRKQYAEEKAAKTAVQLLIPLIMFIFPGIFIVLVGPAAINIMESGLTGK